MNERLNKKKLKELSFFIDHLIDQEEALAEENKEGFLRNHSENCGKLENLLKDSGLVRGEINFKKEREGEDDSD